MSDLKEKLKRQTEMLGLCLTGRGALKQADLEVIFNRDRPTITRDLSALRAAGIDIHSAKKGMVVAARIPNETLGEFILQYIGLNYSAISYDKATAFLVRRLKERALGHIVQLQRCIDEGRIARIDYEKEPGKVEQGKLIAPWMLFQGDHEWRVLAQNDGIRKQFLVCKILAIVPTDKMFKKPPKDTLRNLFEPSWNAWLGEGEEHTIRIAFTKEAMKRYAHRQFVETQRFEQSTDGSGILEASVNSLNEVAAWVVSHSDGVKVLAPMELKQRVVALARKALEQHR